MADDEKHSPNSPPSPSSPISHDKEDLHSPPAYPTLEGTGVGSNNDEYEEFLGLHQRFYGSEEWKRCLRKMDLRLLFPLMMTYLLSFLDRGNVGFLRVAGLLETIPMSDGLYNTALAVFFIFYTTFEIPAQIILKKLGPRIWISAMVVVCGAVLASGAGVSSPTGFILMRLFLGLAESGMMPGINFVLGTWYTREEIAQRISLFFASASLAGAFGGILAWGIQRLNGRYGLEGWRWILLIEGLITAGFGLICPFLIVGWPTSKHSWLSHEEQRYLILRQQYTVDGARVARHTGQNAKLVQEVAGRWHIWLQGIVYYAHTMLGYSITFTLPVIVQALKFSRYESFLIPVPIYFGACVWTVVNAALSDRRNNRWQHTLLPFLIGIVGLVFTLAAEGQKKLVALTMFGLVLIVFGAYSAVPPSLAWSISNFPEPHKHIALAFQVGCGGLGGLTGSFIYMSKQAPKYYTGYGVSLGVAALACAAVVGLWQGYSRVNRQREQQTKEAIEAQWTPDTLAGAGDKSPYFRYQT